MWYLGPVVKGCAWIMELEGGEMGEQAAEVVKRGGQGYPVQAAWLDHGQYWTLPEPATDPAPSRP